MAVTVDHGPVALALTTGNNVNSEVFDQVIEAVKFPTLSAYAQAIPVFKHESYPAMGFLL